METKQAKSLLESSELPEKITHEYLIKAAEQLIETNRILVAQMVTEEKKLPIAQEIRENCKLLKELLQHSFNEIFQ